MAEQKFWITESEISRQAGISQSHVHRVLCGQKRASWPVAKRMAAVLRIDPTVLLERDERAITAAIEAARRPDWA